MTERRDQPRIVIVGGGTAGWMAACLMAQRWRPRGAAITLIEAPNIPIIGVGEGSTPQLKAFFDAIGVAESEWMPACNATYKNGISFHGWSERPGYERYFHPFPSTIDIHTSPGFYFNSHYRRQGYALETDPDRFFVSARLAAERLAPIPHESFPFEMAYGYHFDAHLVGAFLRERAKAQGVAHVEGRVQDIIRGESGDLEAVSLEDARRVSADLFVDATGFRSLLMQETLGVPFQSFASNLFNDAAVFMATPPSPDALNAQTIATALAHGWVWNIPLTNRTGNGYVYSTRYCDADQAEAELRAHLGVGEAGETRRLAMKVGQVARHWERNCLAVGLAQGFIEPLEATALHLVQTTIEEFMSAWEADEFGDGERAAFNQSIRERFEGVRDYIVLHYRANLRTDTDYWRDNAANDALSDRLRAILECWFGGGDLKRVVHDVGATQFYPLTSWICLLGGYGHYPPDDRLQAPSALRQFDLATIEDFVRRCAMNFPAHRDALAALGADAR